MTPVGGPRQRYREQVRAEIKAVAWGQIASTGASALSLNAIAKQLGMSGPALYRYYAGRDDLLTELVLDGYRDLADTLRRAAAGAVDAAALQALAAALRGWALADPQRYLLLYGTPVPGYHAPSEATEVAREIMATLLAATASTGGRRPRDAVALLFWTRLHGVLSLELAGHFTGMPLDPAQLYAAEVESVVEASRQG